MNFILLQAGKPDPNAKLYNCMRNELLDLFLDEDFSVLEIRKARYGSRSRPREHN